MRVRFTPPILVLLALLTHRTSVAQTTVAIPCARDNTLYEDPTGAFSNGVGDSIFVGVTAQGRTRRALVQFDIAAAVPAGARVVAAHLELNVTQSGALQPTNVGGHRLLTSWGEGASFAIAGGGGQGAPSTNGDATWIHRFHAASPWTSPGGDYVTTPSFVMSMPTFGPANAPASSQCIADLQSWLDQPAQNFGWLLRAEIETVQAARARRIESREGPNAPPVLRVTYVLPGQSGSWGTGCATANGTFTFAFVGSMVGGAPIALLHTNGPSNGVGANIFALDLDPIGTPLFSGCLVHLPLNQSWIPGFAMAFDGAGDAAVPWTLPAQYPGLFFISQSVALDAASPLGLVLSDTGLAVIL